MADRHGRQTPTTSVVLPYLQTQGKEAVELYNTTGRKAYEWQQLQCYDIMAMNADGLWTHTRYGLSVPRRNGKNELVVMRELWGLKNGEHILHTAHLTDTAHDAWERLYDACTEAGIPIAGSYRAYGKEHIYTETGGKIEFRTRSSKSGLGRGYDLVVIDEAQEYQADQESALKYVVSASARPQTLLCGTPPTPSSSGDVFLKLRKRVINGEADNAGWAEWSVGKQADPHDRDAWYETNPSLGVEGGTLTERDVLDEIGTDNLDFNIQRLGYWVSYNLKSIFSRTEWEEMKLKEQVQLIGGLHIGIKYGSDGVNVAMSIAVRTSSGNVFVEAIDCRSVRKGNDWIVSFLKQADFESVVVDGKSGQDLLARDMKDAGLKKPVLPKVAEVILANSEFEQSLYAGAIRHMNQPSLTQVVSNCEHRLIGTNGGFGFKAIREGIEIALLDSTILAFWAASASKKKKATQKVYV